ncbi:class I SAM-dependent methyltransferase [Nocardioides KLBMP 9356]|uniref:Class I SAM-dependent methyltransferase n=1 Tax=Nocardioides potassii TaxID=2911371 RepID=A0ABS9HBA9_9ACTN|nr:class I SAM-dependent methyltransferase [Nocardioides potassii]MCF6377551.1 class I SAM-dependent methyltransferase [Nocardioides potassii]
MPDRTPRDASFDAAWRVARTVDGWLTEAQARDLHRAASAVAPGRVVEIGSHLGRSTIVLASTGAAVTAIDPFPDDWRYGRPDTEQRFRDHLAAAGVEGNVDVRVATSRDVRTAWDDGVRLVYVDGKHDMWSCLDDLRWSAFLQPGDTVLVHDAFSSLGVTLALLRDQTATRRHRYVGRTGSLARFEVATPSVGDRLRVVGELPWFARNLLVKVLLRLRLRPAAALLGHRDTADPY